MSAERHVAPPSGEYESAPVVRMTPWYLPLQPVARTAEVNCPAFWVAIHVVYGMVWKPSPSWIAPRSASVPSVEMTSTFIAFVQLVQPGGGVVTASVLLEPVRSACEPVGKAEMVGRAGNGGKSTGPSGLVGMTGGATGASLRVSIGTPAQAGPAQMASGSRMIGPVSWFPRSAAPLDDPPHATRTATAPTGTKNLNVVTAVLLASFPSRMTVLKSEGK